jgi:hypothetical protein
MLYIIPVPIAPMTFGYVRGADILDKLKRVIKDVAAL